jgi:1,4-alpha-glucan branching enzyme
MRGAAKPHSTREEIERMAPLASQDQGSTLLTPYDLHLFNEGQHTRLFEKFGAHVVEIDGRRGTHFAVWAPNAERVSIVGDFNGWNPDSTPMNAQASSGVWEAFVRDLGHGAVYKYHIRSRYHMYTVDKADPFALHNEVPPRTASIVWDLSLRMGRSGMDAYQARTQQIRGTDVRLRSPSRLLDARPRRG